MSYCDHSPSVVRPSTHLYAFSSETPESFFFKFHVGPSVNGGWGVEKFYKWLRSVNQDDRHAHIR